MTSLRNMRLMTIKVNIPSCFQRYTGGADVVEVNGITAGECFNSLVVELLGINRQQQRNSPGESRESINSVILFRHSGQ